MTIDDIPLEEVTGPSDNEVKAVVALAREQWRLEDKVADLRRQLAEAEEQLKNVAERELPNLLVELGIEGLPLKGGVKLELDTEVYASITQANREAAFEWLEAHEHGDIIKRQFTVSFGKEEEQFAAKFKRDLARRKRPLDTTIKRSIHPGTLNKWTREVLAAGEVIPEDLFGVFRKRVTKLIRPKKEGPV